MSFSAWPRETIASLIASGAITAHKDGNYGSLYPRVEEFVDHGVPFLTAKSLDAGRIDIDGAPRLAESRADTLPFGFVRPNDVLLSHNATIGRVAIVRDFEGRMLVGTSLTYFRLNSHKLRPRYFAAFLAGTDFQNQLVAVMSHSTRNQVPITAQRSLSVVVPPLEVQDMIALTVGQLDDKIEENRRTGAKSEALARAVFKAWFVDFEPVKAKAAGATAFPGMPPETFAALPNTFQDSHLGPVPLGWEVKPLSDVVMLTMGQSPKSEFYNEEGRGLPFHQGVTDYGFRFPSARVYCTAEGRIANLGDVLLSVRAPVGRINVADRQLILGRGLGGMRHIDDQQSFLLYQMFHVFAEEDAIGDGTIYKAVNKDFLAKMPLSAPPKPTRDAFEVIAKPMDELVVSAEKQSAKLAALRDYLLPRLLSGRVRVRAAERAIVEAV